LAPERWLPSTVITVGWFHYAPSLTLGIAPVQAFGHAEELVQAEESAGTVVVVSIRGHAILE